MSEDPSHIRTRLELQDLTSAYARGVDRRDYALIESIFTTDGAIIIHEEGNPITAKPSGEMRGRERIGRGMRGIEQYERTTHFVGQHRVDSIDGDRASGETYCLAYHLREREGATWNYIMSIRYQDTYEREDGVWKFAERVLLVDWTDDKPVGR